MKFSVDKNGCTALIIEVSIHVRTNVYLPMWHLIFTGFKMIGPNKTEGLSAAAIIGIIFGVCVPFGIVICIGIYCRRSSKCTFQNKIFTLLRKLSLRFQYNC